MFRKNDVILFQGDSITDCGRNREAIQPNKGLGTGYAALAASRILADCPESSLNFYNRGCSGNRVVDLYARWRVDGINLKPSVISILIGVNDTWHHFNSGNGVEPERYGAIYRMLLEYTREQLPKVRFILCEPFVLRCGVVKPKWVPEIKERSRIVRALATEFGAIFVPFQSLFDSLLAKAPADYWLTDGVHPSQAGHYKMTELWLKTVGAAGKK